MPHERVICLDSDLNGRLPVLGPYCAHWCSWMKACVLSLPSCLRIGVCAWNSLLLSLFHNLFSGFNVHVAVLHAAAKKADCLCFQHRDASKDRQQWRNPLYCFCQIFFLQNIVCCVANQLGLDTGKMLVQPSWCCWQKVWWGPLLGKLLFSFPSCLKRLFTHFCMWWCVHTLT